MKVHAAHKLVSWKIGLQICEGKRLQSYCCPEAPALIKSDEVAQPWGSYIATTVQTSSQCPLRQWPFSSSSWWRSSSCMQPRGKGTPTRGETWAYGGWMTRQHAITHDSTAASKKEQITAFPSGMCCFFPQSWQLIVQCRAKNYVTCVKFCTNWGVFASVEIRLWNWLEKRNFWINEGRANTLLLYCCKLKNRLPPALIYSSTEYAVLHFKTWKYFSPLCWILWSFYLA